jgi:hypothetical protein
MKYSIYIITTFLISASSLFSLVELEEVLKLYPDGGTLYSSSYSTNRVFLNGDTILVRYNLTAKSDSYVLKLSTDRGVNWRDITDNFKDKIGDGFSNSKFSELGSYYLNVNSKDTTLEYFNLDGDLIKLSYPVNKSLRNVSIVLNPLDENFVGYFYNYFEYHHHIHFQTFYTSTDRGENWYYVSPKGGAGFVTIGYNLSIGQKNKIFFSYDWGDVYNSYGGARFSYDTYTRNIEYLSYTDNAYCYECTGPNEYVTRKSGESRYTVVNLNDKSERAYKLFDNTLGLDLDSLSQYNDTVNRPSKFYERVSPTKRATNLRSPNHQIIELTHYEYDSNLYPEEYIFVHQYYFQTFDYGENWELIFENKDKNNLIQYFGINHKDKVFWAIRGEQDDSDYRSDTRKPILYKSKEPLTSVEDSYNSTGMKVSLNDSRLSITSEEFHSNASLRIFNLEGKELQSINQSLNKGLNEININKTNEKLLFISIQMEGNNQIYKLLNNN